ncbi:MAG: hypothetical protein OXB84_00265, partial [Halobacteriovoraceae bacterium]|nr:hypothetical protein [Halobacteriovoraceae bacterium]
MPIKYKIKKESIPLPEVIFTTDAWRQLNLIIDNDFTVQGKFFRILISGKNCDGPIYSTGMTEERSDDFKISIKKEN